MAARDGSSESTHAPETLGVAPLRELRLRSDLRVGGIGDELLVLDADGDVVHRVTGAAVDVLNHLCCGALPPGPSSAVDAAVESLVRTGIVDDGRDAEDDADGSPSRRRVLAAGGTALAAATVTTFALADPAAAATGCTNGVVPTPYGAFTAPGSSTFSTGPVTSVLVRAWGGGGGGGGGTLGYWGGGGGGGGAYGSQVVAVFECSPYTILVGDGGLGGMPRSFGGPGGTSAFGAGYWVSGGGPGGSGQDPSIGGGAGAGGIGGPTGTLGSVRTGGTGGTGTFRGGGGGGGGSAGHTGNGGSGSAGGGADVAGGAAGAGPPGGAVGGTWSAASAGGAGNSPGAGGGGGSGPNNQAGGAGAPGAVWVGV